MLTLFILTIAAGAFLLWYLPVPKDRTRRMATQVGGTTLFGIGLCGLVLQLMGPVSA
ncbi:hypothetical protein [Croceicoccus naphthovorans]|uniref:hypothetical protein n=1 Tax=Croceicoccus naphthovorans TaxID=1348774 RepID=UPI000A86A2C4|nr:hypothetical protein [Croceicoccus naphthovorans]MBB3991458.1 hypothetical protein [Croceicoccus naphthovorans]